MLLTNLDEYVLQRISRITMHVVAESHLNNGLAAANGLAKKIYSITWHNKNERELLLKYDSKQH